MRSGNGIAKYGKEGRLKGGIKRKPGNTRRQLRVCLKGTKKNAAKRLRHLGLSKSH